MRLWLRGSPVYRRNRCSRGKFMNIGLGDVLSIDQNWYGIVRSISTPSYAASSQANVSFWDCSLPAVQRQDACLISEETRASGWLEAAVAATVMLGRGNLDIMVLTKKRQALPYQPRADALLVKKSMKVGACLVSRFNGGRYGLNILSRLHRWLERKRARPHGEHVEAHGDTWRWALTNSQQATRFRTMITHKEEFQIHPNQSQSQLRLQSATWSGRRPRIATGK